MLQCSIHCKCRHSLEKGCSTTMLVDCMLNLLKSISGVQQVDTVKCKRALIHRKITIYRATKFLQSSSTFHDRKTSTSSNEYEKLNINIFQQQNVKKRMQIPQRGYKHSTERRKLSKTRMPFLEMHVWVQHAVSIGRIVQLQCTFISANMSNTKSACL